MAKLAAKELQTYLAKISGAKLPIVTKPGGAAVRIFVGKSSFTEALKLATDGLENGAFRMVSGPTGWRFSGRTRTTCPIEPWGRFFGRAETARVECGVGQDHRRHVLEPLRHALHPLPQRPRRMGL